MSRFEKARRKERRRIEAVFGELSPKKRELADGLIDEAAFMRVKLRELRSDLEENGFAELFSQGKDQEPYERERISARHYASMNSSYQKIIKQLTDLLPKEAQQKKELDDFEDF